MGHLKGFWISPSWRRNISEGLVARYGNARVLVLSICAGTFARKVTLTKSTPGVEISSLRSKLGTVPGLSWLPVCIYHVLCAIEI